MARYGIGIAYGLGFRDGIPEIHALNKLGKLRELLYSGEVQRGIITAGNEVDVIADYFVNRMEVPRENIYTDKGRSFVDHMHHIRGRVGRWVENGEIPEDVLLHHIVTDWAEKRAEFDAKWVIRDYTSIVHGVEDGRPEEEMWKDSSEEPNRMKIDQLTSRIPIVSEHLPDVAQLVASLRYPSSLIRYGYRLLSRV